MWHNRLVFSDCPETELAYHLFLDDLAVQCKIKPLGFVYVEKSQQEIILNLQLKKAVFYAEKIAFLISQKIKHHFDNITEVVISYGGKPMFSIHCYEGGIRYASGYKAHQSQKPDSL